MKVAVIYMLFMSTTFSGVGGQDLQTAQEKAPSRETCMDMLKGFIGNRGFSISGLHGKSHVKLESGQVIDKEATCVKVG